MFDFVFSLLLKTVSQGLDENITYRVLKKQPLLCRLQKAYFFLVMTLWWFIHLKPILRASFQAYWIGTFGVNLQDTCVFNLCRWLWWTANVQAQRFLYQTILCKRHICGLNITLGLRDTIIIWTGWQQRRCPSVRPGIAWEILRSSLWVSRSAQVKFQWKTASQGEVIASSIIWFHAYVKVCLFLSLLIEIQSPLCYS